MSRTALKHLAFTTMVIDHLAVTLFIVLRIPYSPVYDVMRLIGRIAFPIFGFCMVEGARHTSNKWKYALRVLLLAVISEVPFDLALFGTFWTTLHQNVGWTLLLGLLPIFLLQEVIRKEGRERIGFIALYVLSLGAAAFAARYILHCDYTWSGVSMLTVMSWQILPWKKWFPGISDRTVQVGISLLAVIALSILCLWDNPNTIEPYAVLSLIPISYYNGRRSNYPDSGRRKNWLKRSGYFIYPGHLAILGLAVYFIK